MYRTFNMGLGLVACVPPEAADKVQAAFEAAGETVQRVGRVVAAQEGSPRVILK